MPEPVIACEDVTYVYRECALLAPGWLDCLLAGGAPFVFDFDDAIYLPAASEASILSNSSSLPLINTSSSALGTMGGGGAAFF